VSGASASCCRSSAARIALLSGHPTITALFVGTALVATSVGITRRVLEEQGCSVNASR
jgi:Kef-type K+ transport system membrane component KefB